MEGHLQDRCLLCSAALPAAEQVEARMQAAVEHSSAALAAGTAELAAGSPVADRNPDSDNRPAGHCLLVFCQEAGGCRQRCQ